MTRISIISELNSIRPELPEKPTPDQFSKWMIWHIAQAIKKNGKLHRVFPGWYLVKTGNVEITEIERLKYDEPHDLDGWWIARVYNGYDYTDPYPTLRELKKRLKLS